MNLTHRWKSSVQLLEFRPIPVHIGCITMKVICLLILLAALPAWAQTNEAPYCCRYPLRTLRGNGTVDLKPLFNWWIQRGGKNDVDATAASDYVDLSRPLTAWKRIKGEVTSQRDGVWVVDAQIYTTPAAKTNEWILLQHPPVYEEQQYYYLKQEIAQDDEAITNDLQTRAAQLKAAKRAEDHANRDARDFAKSVRAYSYNYDQIAARDKQAAAATMNDEKGYEQDRDQAQKLLKGIPAKEGKYVLDCFALELGRNSRGQMVYDAGAAVGYSQ